MPILSTSLLVCEKVLREEDKVLSAIRIVDVFRVKPHPNVSAESRAIPMNVLAVAKVSPDDHSEHTVLLQLIRPDGETKALGEVIKSKFEAKSPATPGGFNLIAQIGVVPKQMGTHYVVLSLDGNEVARTPFTIVEVPETEAAE